ncbi:MAG: hypothetical protein DWQ34_26490 [Planctomycetota bacterium]|nr:MAG: hypothetical protein DWQ34_26490 [Planctomycetota bacterium]REJ90762.1 MAG: hypothetical protein DWQ29_06335 [Planctomycetota bacterium]REK22771.1 MAG: hypothetical protein DWQ41_18395 [Planctomycetota bacterium]
MLNSAVSGQFDRDFVVRGQSPYVAAPLTGPQMQGNTTTLYPPTYAPDGTTYPTYDPALGTSDPFAAPVDPYQPAPIGSDPWLGNQAVPPGAYAPYAAPAGIPQGFYTFGLNGPRPYRYGCAERVNVGWLPSVGTSGPDVGNFGIFEVDVEKEYVTPVNYNWVFTVGPQFNFRAWDGPTNGAVGPSHLPGQAYRFGLNLKLATPQYGGWSGEVGFTPAIATDFEASFGSDTLFYDAHAVAFWQWSPQWTWALGAAYWDRVDNIVLPYAGVVYAPNDYWEFRLVFPKPRISYFLGTPYGVATWVYVGAEYNVEAYHIALSPPGVDTRVQVTDWRAYGGLRFEAGQYASFIEAGASLGREVEFDHPAGADFDVDNGFFTRLGLRW